MSRYATSGDRRDFEVVCREVAPRLRALVLRLTRCQADTEEIVWQTLVNMDAARGRFILGADVMKWARSIAVNLAKDRHRRFGRRARVISDIGVPDGASDPCGWSALDDLKGKDLQRIVEFAVAELPESQRIAYQMVRLEGCSHEEVAETTGNSTSGVKALVHRAAVKVRDIVQKMWGD